MPIFNNYKCVFVHVPKCAGTSVSNAFADGDPNFLNSDYRKFSLKFMKGRNLEHQTAKRLSFLAPIRFRTFYKFAFVRNPYDRMVSEFKWRSTWDNLTKNGTFKDMLKKVPEYRSKREPHFISSKDFLTDRKGTLLVDYVGRFETIDADFKEITRTLGFNKKLPNKNVTKNNNYNYINFYDDETKSLVDKYFSDDLDFFNYRFDEI